ncbi:hypothetical protein [Thermus parvatiensis]|nr:hypothetical protein [Thermus parvatiensis]
MEKPKEGKERGKEKAVPPGEAARVSAVEAGAHKGILGLGRRL